MCFEHLDQQTQREQNKAKKAPAKPKVEPKAEPKAPASKKQELVPA